MSKFKKIDKDFLLTDSSVNSYGYRLLTSGYLMSEFEKNPIGYYMHDRDKGVLVKWQDLRMDGDKVFGKPCINMSHPRGEQTVDEIENGFLNAASFGHFQVLGVSDKPEDYLPEQTGPSVNKWFNRECSLVDLPGNFNALKELFDANDHPIKFENLADMKPQFINMTKAIFTPEQITLMNLKADADQASVNTAFADLVAKAAKVDGLTAQLTVAETAKKTAEDALAASKIEAAKKEVKDLLAKGIADKKLTVELSGKLEKQFEGKPVELKDLLDAMPAYQGIVASLDKGDKTDYSAKTWSELDKEGKLQNLKDTNLPLFKEKYKAAFNKEYTGK